MDSLSEHGEPAHGGGSNASFMGSSEIYRKSRSAPPAVSYSTASLARVKRLFDEYGCEGPVDARLYSRGVSDTYLLSTPTRKFALKVYRAGWRSRDAIAEEVAAIRHVHMRNVTVVMPIARCDGEWISYMRAPEGLRPALLFPWAKGKAPRYTDADHARKFGAVVAELHNAADDFSSYDARPRLNVDYLLQRPIDLIRSQLHELPDVASRLERLREHLGARFEQMEKAKLDWGFCHGDIWAGNACIEADDLALFDFDFFGLGWRAFDLATYRWHARRQGAEALAWGAFLRGYLAIRPLAKESLPFIDLFMMARHLWTKAHGIGLTPDFGIATITDEYLEDAVSFCEKLEQERSL